MFIFSVSDSSWLGLKRLKDSKSQFMGVWFICFIYTRYLATFQVVAMRISDTFKASWLFNETS